MHKFGLFFDTLEQLQAAHAKLMGGAPVATAPAAPLAPPAAPLAPPSTPLAPPAPAMPAAPLAPPTPAMPAAPLAPPAPPAPPTAIVPPAAAPGAPTQADAIAAMGRVVGLPGGATKLSPILARYNAQAPGTVGPVTTVDPAQYQNFINELNAVV